MEYKTFNREDFNKILIEEFPMLYGEVSNIITVGSGWYDIIYTMSKKLNDLIQTYENKDFRIQQIKEKFGVLRVYIYPYTKEVSDIISEAEHSSNNVCEMCGATGELHGKYWIKTLCKDCNIKREAKWS